MNWFTGLVMFILIWWTVLFAVLPWGVKHNMAPKPDEQTPGAPDNPKLWRKFLVTTLLSAMLWSVIFAAIEFRMIDFRGASLEMMAAKEGNAK